jgi:hypothetical protein
MNPGHLSHTGAGLPKTGTGSADTVPKREDPNHLTPAHRRLLRFIQNSLWPLSVIAVGVLVSVAWSAALFWLVTYAIW